MRHRAVRTKGALASSTARLMVFKLVIAASNTWRWLKGENQLPKVVAGVNFATAPRSASNHQPAPPETSVTQIPA